MAMLANREKIDIGIGVFLAAIGRVFEIVDGDETYDVRYSRFSIRL
jgi:hypothetical protein